MAAETEKTSRRILIVDDEEGIRNVFRRVLAFGMPECEVTLAANGAEGVERFIDRAPDVILMDLHMPVMDGEAAFMRIRDICARESRAMPPVVFCTGFDASNELQRMTETDPHHCLLRKPVSNDELIATLRSRLQ